MDNEYLPTEGSEEYVRNTLNLAFGKEWTGANYSRVAACQTVGGTGALRLNFELMRKYLSPSIHTYLPKPTWHNHYNIVRNSGFTFKEYRYLDERSKEIDIEGLINDLE